MHGKRLIFLSSKIGYGIYFPALILKKQLEKQGFIIQIFILEDIFSTKAQETFKKTKTAFKKNFRLAQIAAQFPIDYATHIDQQKIKLLLDQWSNSDTLYFLCFSGLWLPLLKQYKIENERAVIDCCRVDAGQSTVWDKFNDYDGLVDLVYFFFDFNNKQINYVLDIPELQRPAFDKRPHQITIHGGGWDLGDFAGKANVVVPAGFNVNLVVNDPNEIQPDQPEGIRVYTNEKNWTPGQSDDFPGFAEIAKNQPIHYKTFSSYPGIMELIAESRAIVSKPGGMTLMDSLVTETPLIFLEPMGPNEQGNGELWDHLGLGLNFEAWEQANFDSDCLIECNHNLISLKKNIPSFSTEYSKHINSL